MKISFSTGLLIACVFLTMSGDALAWGPVTHTGLSLSVLDHLGMLPAAVALVLGRYTKAFLYGSIAADVVFAKRLSRVKQFCHHWSTAFGLLERAESERDKAFAYGYLSHLAADTVAHGKYVPHQLLTSDCTMTFGHLYWELRADAEGSAEARDTLASVLVLDNSRYNRILERHLSDTFLPFDLNRALFEGLSALAVDRRFHWSIECVSRISRWPLSRPLLLDYLNESVERIESVLREGSRSPVVREDPNGTSSIMRVYVHRKDWRRLGHVGVARQSRLAEAAAIFRPASAA